MSQISEAAEAAARLIQRIDRLRNRRKLWTFQPYPKQQAFFDMGSYLRERLLMAGNQLGKTEAGAVEMAYHLTGEYPADWLGKKFDHPVQAWACGESTTVVMDVQQAKLCGEPNVEGSLGTGYIPLELFVGNPALARGVTGAFASIAVKHKTNGVEDGTSTLAFKSYEQGRTKFQGKTLDIVWLDEEPDLGVYSECLARIGPKKGILYMTFTPLKGKSSVVMRYTDEPSEDRGFIVMTIEDAGHYTPEERLVIIAGYPAHERDARARGIPLFGDGLIFPYIEEEFTEEGFRPDEVPLHWAKMWAIDFGIGHPFAAVLAAWDKDTDVIHVLHAIRMKDALPLQHAVPMKAIGASVPVAWPQDGTSREKTTGETIAVGYKQQGLLMLPTHATWEDGGVSTEAGILEMQDRMTTGRLKIAKHLKEWHEERRMYHRKDGQIVKVHDDLMSATRVWVMAKRHARPVPLGGHAPARRRQMVANDLDFDLS